jgi:hypothetical protein
MLRAQSGFSQNVYPRLSIINSDTLCLLNIEQVRDINAEFIVRLDEAREKFDSLKSNIHSYRLLAQAQQASLDNMEKDLMIQGALIRQKDGLINIANTELQTCRKDMRKMKFQKSLGWICAGLIATIVLIK